MIKETDASKNDERRVKNKPIPLTHKKKGETHIMGNQGMKNWKLGAFFVVSLVLMVGLFANTVPAHQIVADSDTTADGEIKITSKVTADSMVDLVIRYEATRDLAVIGKVIYAVDNPDTDDDESVNADGDKIVADHSSKYGRIQITLPADWGPDNSQVEGAVPPGNMINVEYVPGKPDVTYLSYTKSSRAKLEAAELNPDDRTMSSDPTGEGGLNATFLTGTNQWRITIDVDDLKNNQYVVLTVNNLMIPPLRSAPTTAIDRESRTTDITAEDLEAAMETVTVLSNRWDAVVIGGRGTGSDVLDAQDFDSARDDTSADTLNTLEADDSHAPSVIHKDNKVATITDQDQPYVTVERKALGTLTVSETSVTAGSMVDLKIEYKFSEPMDVHETAVVPEPENRSVIEISLPPGWDAGIAPTPIAPDADLPTPAQAKDMDGYVYINRPISSSFEGATLEVINAAGVAAIAEGEADANSPDLAGWFLRITLAKDVSKNRTLVLYYRNAKAPRAIALDPKLKIEAFSDPDVEADATELIDTDTDDIVGIPQHPVTKQDKVIEVKHAANNSGMVTFKFGGETVNGSEDPTENTEVSIPAGLTAEDGYDLLVTYKPIGEMGEGEFELRMPSGWSAADILYSGEESATPADSAVASGDIIKVTFPDRFGRTDDYLIDITLVDIAVPNEYGNQRFSARAKNEKGRLTPLSMRAEAFVGNTMAADDTVTVDISPEAAYEKDTGVDFEIELTATGPMHDGRIQIVMPNVSGDNVFGDIQDEDRDEPNYVRVSASVRGVDFAIGGVDDEIIVMTGDLDADETITVRIEDVDILDDVAGSLPFEVGTKTRAPEPTADDPMPIDEDDDPYEPIAAKNITGGMIRTIKGSGTMAVDPINVEQGSRNVDFTLTFKAQADFSNFDLKITAPDVIDTELQKDNRSGDGYVNGSGGAVHADHKDKDAGKADDELVVSNNTITWNGLILNEGRTFTTTIADVDILEETGPAQWVVTLEGVDITADDDDNFMANPPMVVVGTTEDDVVFEIIEDGSAVFDPFYPAASEQDSILFRFTTENTTIQEGGELRFRLPSGWTRPGLVGDESTTEATVAIITQDKDGKDIPATQVPPTGEDNAGEEMTLIVQRRDVIIQIGEEGELDADSDPIIIQYGTKEHPVTISARAEGTDGKDDDGLAIRGHFKVSDDFNRRDAGTIFVDVTNVEDGSGDAMFDPTPRTIRAGSDGNLITVVFTAVGTMDGGAVRFTIADDWGEMQDEDPLELNYIEVDVSGTGAALDGDPEIINDGRSVDANLETFGEGDKVTFTYGGGSAPGSDSNGAMAAADIGNATFMVESYGGDSGDNSGFVDIREVGDDDEADTEDPLVITVKGAASGSGDGAFVIESTSAGPGLYDGVTDMDEEMLQVHAGDDSTYIVFTYTATQTIAEGKLRFTVPPGWSEPQDESTGKAGYTYLDEIGSTTSISNEDYDLVPNSVQADIALNLGDSIEIHYGAENGGAEAPDAVPPGGYSQFAISIQGTLDTDAGFNDISDEDLAVKVRVQRSGGGMAEVSPTNVNAGDAMSTITVTYTADGEINAGGQPPLSALRLTIPENWDPPTSGASGNVMVTGGGSGATMRASGDHTEAELTALTAAAAAADLVLGTMDFIVDNVMLAGGEKVVFTYTSAMAQGTMGDADFAVAVNGGDGPGTAIMPVEKSMTTVTVGEAGSGSGMIAVDTGGIILAGSTTDKTLTFTYTVAGEASYPKDVRIAVPDGWDVPIAGNYTVSHKSGTQSSRAGTMVEQSTRVPGSMVARVVRDQTLMSGDLIIFVYTSTTTPAEPETSPFVVEFDGGAVTEGNSDVLVQAAEASMLDIDAPTKVSADMKALPAKITIMIQDADGGEAAVAEDVTVGLSSTSSTGSFSETPGGAAMDQVTIKAGMSSKMVYYSDSRVGSTAILTVSDDAGVLTHDTASIVVSTDVLALNSVSFMISGGKDVAMDGDMITVTADIAGTPSEMPTFTIDSIVIGGGSDMSDDDGDGTYTGSHTLASGSAEGSHNVTVHVAGAEPPTMMAEDMLVVDNTMPSVTITAPAADMTVANGESVTITATVSETSTVMADVSALDSTQTDVALIMGADGSYSVDVLISKENTHVNGSKTITVTAMDAAGNSSPMAEVMVMLDSMLSFTSMIPAGNTVLFHVPLDEDGLDTVGDLKTKIGDAVNLAIIWNTAESRWDSNTDDLAITADLGLILAMKAEATVTFKGDAWGNGISQIELKAGRNIIGLPLKDPSVTKVSDLLTALGVDSVTVAANGGFVAVAAAGDPGGDGPVMGDAAYMVTSAADDRVPVLGSGWSNGDAASAAPIALAGYNVDNQTPVLDVRGSVVDEITGLAREGFRVKVKNLSTKAALSRVSSVEAADGYNMTFVDLTDAHAARVGDVLEISANSPDPLVGVKPVRHIVTIDDVKSNRIQLENLIAYEIPAETELLRNYPNPFNPETWIPYHLAEDADVSLTIYDTTGRLVRTIDMGHQTAAKYDTRSKAIYWDGRNQFGEQVASGLYFYSLIAGDFSATRRMVILK